MTRQDCCERAPHLPHSIYQILPAVSTPTCRAVRFGLTVPSQFSAILWAGSGVKRPISLHGSKELNIRLQVQANMDRSELQRHGPGRLRLVCPKLHRKGLARGCISPVPRDLLGSRTSLHGLWDADYSGLQFPGSLTKRKFRLKLQTAQTLSALPADGGRRLVLPGDTLASAPLRRRAC